MNCGLPAHSPIAHTSGAVVSNRSLTLNVAAAVQLDAGLREPDPRCVRHAPRRDQDVAAFNGLFTEGVRTARLTSSPDRPCDIEDVGRDQKLDTFVTQNPVNFIRDVRDPPAHRLGTMFDDRDAAAEATVSLGHFETDIAAAEDDQV